MSFLDWISAKVSPYLRGAQRSGGVGTPADESPKPVCPYCNYHFKTMPTHKRRCPECRNTIYYRKIPGEGKSVLIKEDQVTVFNKPWLQGKDA